MDLSVPRQLPLSLPLRDSSTLDSFVTTPGSSVQAAVHRLLEAPGYVYVWGAAGTGRSHLLEAAVRQALARGQRACLLSAPEMLATDVALLEGLEQQHCLAIDDIDILAGRADWEEGLFHLYNRLMANGCSFLCSASLPPAAAGFALADLASRLAAGPVYQLEQLDDDARAELLIRRAASRGLELGQEVANFIALRAPRTNSALLSCLEQLDRAAWEYKRRLTLPFVKETLGW